MKTVSSPIFCLWPLVKCPVSSPLHTLAETHPDAVNCQIEQPLNVKKCETSGEIVITVTAVEGLEKYTCSNPHVGPDALSAGGGMSLKPFN